jgi:hypothetical protein
MPQLSDASKDAALRAVGRAVVNFQRLEHNLKLAAQLGSLQGTVQKIQRDIAKWQERAGTLTLGHAIQAWLNHYDGTQEEGAWTPDLFDVSIRTTFSLESDADARIAHAKALRSLLDTRNNLVHARLATFEWASVEACDALVLELNAVNVSIAEQLEYVTSLLKQFLMLQRQHAEALSVKFGLSSVASTKGESDA